MNTGLLRDPDPPMGDARQRRSRKALHEALLALLEEKAFDQITIRDIAARAGIGYATFFRHFPSREALLGDIASEEIARLLALALPVLQAANSLESTRALCRYVGEHRPLWTALATGGAAGIVRDEFIRQARMIEHPMEPDGNGAEDWLPRDLGIVHGTGATFDVLAWWLSQAPGQFSVEEIAAILHRLVIAPLIR